MSNLTQRERESLNELFCRLKADNLPFYKRLLLRLNHLIVVMKMYLLH